MEAVILECNAVWIRSQSLRVVTISGGRAEGRKWKNSSRSVWFYLSGAFIYTEQPKGVKIVFIRTSLRQAFRSPVRMVTSFLLMLLVCAFLTLGMNLRATTAKNLKAVYESYEVIAIPDFQAYVSRSGELAEMGKHRGYWPCQAEDYDLTPILSAKGVQSVDVRKRFGAYVGAENFRRGYTYPGSSALRYSDVIRFVYEGEEPVTLPGVDRTVGKNIPVVPIHVTWSASDIPLENYRSKMPIGNAVDSITVTLQPGVEYIATVTSSKYAFGQELYQIKPDNLMIQCCEYYCTTNAYYDNGAHWESGYYANLPYQPIVEYTEDFWEGEQGEHYRKATECCRYNLTSVNAVTTNDLLAFRPFYSGVLSVVDGRMFTQEDYTSGAKVCLVSRYLAGLNLWKVGDKIDLSFFESDYMYTGQLVELLPRYGEPVDGFFDTGTYEIIGLYDGRMTTDLHGLNCTLYNVNMGGLWLDIYLPEQSVENAPAPKLSEYTTTIRLEPLSGQGFLAEMADSGLMEKKSGSYQLGLTVYDQGLSAMADGFEQLEDLSNLTVALSLGASILAVIVLAVFHTWCAKKEIAVLRSLGLSRGKTVRVTLAALLIVCCLGCAAGSVLGYRLSARVAEQIMMSAAEDAGDMSFTANIAEKDWLSLRKEYQFQTVQQIDTAVYAAIAVAGAMILISMVLAWRESGKPPLHRLGRRE